MPPKKRREAPATEKIGIARQYLTDNFSGIGGSVLKNGHVLLYYLENQRSGIKTINYAKGILDEGSVICRNHVTALAKHYVDKYKNLKVTAEMTTFTLICAEGFLISRQIDDSVS